MKRFRLLAAVTAALAGLSISLPALPTPDISYADRLRAQEAIERVYYAHQIEATKPFEEAVPREVIGRKVRTTLQQSVALETYWNTQVTDADLDREVDRMVRTTRMADRLRELFAALGNDPIMIREGLARPALVSRLLRNFYASDPHIHAPARAEAEALRLRLGKGPREPEDQRYARGSLELLREGAAEPEVQDADQRPTEARTEIGKPRRESISDEELKDWRSRLAGKPGGVGEVREERAEFVVPVLLEDLTDAMTLAIYSVPKKPLEIWWKEVEAGLDPAAARPVRAAAAPGAPPVTTVPKTATASTVIPSVASCTPVNTWNDTDLLGGLPVDRYYHTAVWTGSVMIVWGGFGGDTAPLNSGGRYDPATDTWEATSLVGAPAARGRHSAVWTGTRMIIWGGASFPARLNSGGQYDPVSDSWTPTQLLSAPEPRYVHTAIWTGSEMLIWGGSGSTPPSTAEWLQTGGRYNPATDSWLPIGMPGAPAGRNGHVAVWTGTKMIIWGGLVTGNVSTPTGGRYDPSADTWQPTSLTAAPGSQAYDTAVWTGTRMIVSGSQYNPVLDTWTAISMSGAPTPRSEETSIWTGTHMIVWGGTNGSTNYNTGGRYDPASNTWTATSTTGAPWGRFAHSAIWTGNRMIIWGGRSISVMTNTGGRYDPSTDSWSPTALSDAPPAMLVQPGVWTGTRMIVWGGLSFSGHSQVGGRYDPALNEWTPTSLLSAPSARSFHTAVWAGSRLIIWGGQTGGLGTWTNTGGRYDPIADTWSPTSLIGAPSPRRFHTAVWTGNRMVVWGGSDTSPESNTGGRYDPDTDTWLPTSLTNAPESRVKHTAIWTGSRMIIWGGSSSQDSVFHSSGGLYDPVTDAWSPTLWNLSTPPGRVEHTAIWTGSQMIVWGGRSYSSGCSSVFEFFDTGSRYDPVSDTWSPISAFPTVNGSEGRRAGHTAVWNGSPGTGEMIVWGGYKEVVFEPNCNTRIYPAGGRYNPVSDTWTLMTTPPAPEPRAYHRAVSTGNLMLIWGGVGGSSQQRPLRDGGSYVLVEDYDGDGFTCPADCNGSDPAIHPGATEVCNHVDDNCNGAVDEGFPDADGDGYAVCAGDCNDGNPAIHPLATEVCNLMDDNCDGLVDEGFLDDLDGDGFTCPADCNDSDPAIHPGATELCNQVDDDCDGVADGVDADGDGYTCPADCNDNNPAIHPGAAEVCNGVEDNCNGFVDEGFPDADADGYAACGGDCNDGNPAIHPGAVDSCDHFDNDCDGLVDEGYSDNDADGYAVCAGDCNDSNPAVNPGAPEICDGVDNNCNFLSDEGFDQDLDGYTSCSGDCNNANPSIYPGAPEVCNQIDDDCDGTVDEGFDFDGDGHSYCSGGGDCDDQNSTVWSPAVEVTGLALSSSTPTLISWDSQATLAGPQTSYFLASGSLGPGAGVDFSASECLLSNETSSSAQDSRPDPTLGHGFWFLAAAVNNCAWGTYGSSSGGAERIVANCP